MGGLVLLVLIGVLVAWFATKGRQKMKLPVTGKIWAWIIVAVVLVLAIAYGASGHVSPH
jgi:drug/metabolite transporter (DMT)-like permease